MGALAGFLVSVFSGLFGWFAQYLSKKVALGASVLASMAALTAVFYAGVQALVVGVTAQIADPWVLTGFYLFWPSNASACISAVLGAKVAAFLYRQHSEAVRLVSQVS